MGWITQFSLNMVSPIVLCIIIALWLKNKFNIGNWIMITAIILGTASAIVNMFTYIKTVRKELGGTKNEQRDKE